MDQDPAREIVGTAYRPVSRRRRVISLTIAAAVALVLALVAIPRMLGDSSSKVHPHTQPDAKRKQLLQALSTETTTRTDALFLSSGIDLAFMADDAYPADLAALDQALHDYNRVPAPGDSIAWYFPNDTAYVFCVEHHTQGKPDAYALYGSAVGNIVDTDHGEGCMAAPADYAGAEAIVASFTGTT